MRRPSIASMRGEDSFIAARHQLPNNDTDLALAYCEQVLTGVDPEVALKLSRSPLSCADFLGDIALFGLQIGQEQLACTALTKAADINAGVTPKVAFKAGIDPARITMTTARINLLADVLGDESYDRSLQKYMGAVVDSKEFMKKRIIDFRRRAEACTDKKSKEKEEENVRASIGTRAELAVLDALNHSLQGGSVAIHMSSVFDKPNMTLIAEGRGEFKISADVELIDTNASNHVSLPTRFFQVKRHFGLLLPDKPYAPHVPVIGLQNHYGLDAARVLEQRPLSEVPPDQLDEVTTKTNTYLRDYSGRFYAPRISGQLVPESHYRMPTE